MDPMEMELAFARLRSTFPWQDGLCSPDCISVHGAMGFIVADILPEDPGRKRQIRNAVTALSKPRGRRGLPSRRELRIWRGRPNQGNHAYVYSPVGERILKVPDTSLQAPVLEFLRRISL